MTPPDRQEATGDVGSPDELTITDNLVQRRYEARVGAELAGWVDYGRVESRIVALHTEVRPEFGGRGIASALVRRVLDDARTTGARVTPRCPFFAAHFRRHPEDADLMAVPSGTARDASKQPGAPGSSTS